MEDHYACVHPGHPHRGIDPQGPRVPERGKKTAPFRPPCSAESESRLCTSDTAAYQRIRRHPSEIHLVGVQRAEKMRKASSKSSRTRWTRSRTGDEQTKHAGESDRASRLRCSERVAGPFVGFWDEAAASQPGPENPWGAAKPTATTLGHMDASALRQRIPGVARGPGGGLCRSCSWSRPERGPGL